MTTVALRVLTAVNRREKPEEQDLLLLHSYCPGHEGLESDELACIVIQQVMERKKLMRQAMVNDGN